MTVERNFRLGRVMLDEEYLAGWVEAGTYFCRNGL